MREVTIGREDCFVPDNKEELDSLFKPMAEEFGEELTPDFCFEGNSDKTMDWLYMLIKSVGYGRVAIPTYVLAPNADHCDTVYVNIKNLDITEASPDLHADEIDWNKDGWLRLWWD